MRSIRLWSLALAAIAVLAGRGYAEEPKQVKLDVMIVEVDEACLETLGFTKPINQSPALTMDPAQLQDFLTIRRSLGLAKLMANPQIVTLSGKPAHFQLGSEVPLVSGGNPQSVPEVTMVPIGIRLSMTPVVLDGQQLEMNLELQSSALSEGIRTAIPATESAKGNAANNAFDAKKLKGMSSVSTETCRIETQLAQGKALVIARPQQRSGQRATLCCVIPTCFSPSEVLRVAPQQPVAAVTAPACCEPKSNVAQAAFAYAAVPMPAVPPQVLLNVIVMEVDRVCLETLGLGKPQTTQVIMEPARCKEFITLHRSRGMATILAEPQLIAQAGEEATVQIGQTVPFYVESSRENVKQAIMVPTGFGLKVTPMTTGADQLKLDIALQRNALTAEYSNRWTASPTAVANAGTDTLDIFAAGKLKALPGFDARSCRTTVELPRGKTIVLGALSRDTDARATLVCVTPSGVLTPAQPPAAVVGATKSNLALAAAPQPARPMPVPGGEEWNFTAKADQLVVRSHGGQQLEVKQLVTPLNAKDFRFGAANGRVLLEGPEFRCIADGMTYTRLTGTLVLKGHVQFETPSQACRLETQAGEVTLDLATGSLNVRGAAKLVGAAAK